jgi:hypothetical protein
MAFGVAINRAWDEAQSGMLSRIEERMPKLDEKAEKAL